MAFRVYTLARVPERAALTERLNYGSPLALYRLPRHASSPARDQTEQIADAIRISPFIVVPTEAL
jgi:hypothetical protein